MIGSSMVLGMTIGAVCGGLLMRIGRWNAVILVNILGIIGSAITITPLNYSRILIGRTLLGLSAGLMSSVCPKMLEETLPNHLFDKLGPMFTTMQCIGSLIACLLVLMIPDDKDTEALKQCDLWKVAYGYFPIACMGTSVLLMLTIVRSDSVKFLIVKNNQKQARIAIRKLYKQATSDAIADNYIENLRQKLGNDSSGLTLIDAVANPTYRKATWVNIGYIMFHELTGINVIFIYSD
jgi:MFS family permease